MRDLKIAASVATLVLCLAAMTQAAELPTVNEPVAGAALGPNYEILGSLSYRALVVVLTDAVLAETGELLATVPGIRHYTNEDGTFHFRCASPRVARGYRGTELRYRIRVFTMDAEGNKGPERVINCTSAE